MILNLENTFNNYSGDERISSPSISINLEQSRESNPDQSICSNPQQESPFFSKATMSQKEFEQHRQPEIQEIPLEDVVNIEMPSSRKRRVDHSERSNYFLCVLFRS